MLYLRSEPLKEGSTYRVVVYPTTSAYLATITVTGREKINVRAGSYNAIKMDLQLSKIGNNFELQPHRKFRKATIWISDDPDRIILRVEAQIFVGTIFAELQAVKFETPEGSELGGLSWSNPFASDWRLCARRQRMAGNINALALRHSW